MAAFIYFYPIGKKMFTYNRRIIAIATETGNAFTGKNIYIPSCCAYCQSI